jgi:hypothetical protein
VFLKHFTALNDFANGNTTYGDLRLVSKHAYRERLCPSSTRASLPTSSIFLRSDHTPRIQRSSLVREAPSSTLPGSGKSILCSQPLISCFHSLNLLVHELVGKTPRLHLPRGPKSLYPCRAHWVRPGACVWSFLSSIVYTCSAILRAPSLTVTWMVSCMSPCLLSFILWWREEVNTHAFVTGPAGVSLRSVLYLKAPPLPPSTVTSTNRMPRLDFHLIRSERLVLDLPSNNLRRL